MVKVSPLSTSTSFLVNSTKAKFLELSSEVVKMPSSLATGASLTLTTLIVTVAVVVLTPSILSSTLNVKVSVPTKSNTGV